MNAIVCLGDCHARLGGIEVNYHAGTVGGHTIDSGVVVGFGSTSLQVNNAIIADAISKIQGTFPGVSVSANEVRLAKGFTI